MNIFKVKLPPEWSIEPVPEKLRILRLIDISILWFSLSIGLLVIQAGTFLTIPVGLGGLGLSIYDSFFIAVAGSFTGSLILALAGTVGSRHGVPPMVSLRPSFGLLGSYLPTLLNVIQLVGWTVFEFIIMGEAATSITGKLIGPLTRYVWITVFAVFAFLLFLGGPLMVVRHWLEKFAIWFAIAGAFILSYQLLTIIPTFEASSVQFNSALLALDLVVAMPISWLPLVSDYNRFAKNMKGGFFGTLVSYTIANTWFYMLGALLGAAYPKEAVTYSMSFLFLGIPALLVILTDEPDNAFADIYSAAVSIQNVFPKQRQLKIGTMIVLISLALAYVLPIVQYENFLLLIGASFIPVFGILISDFFLLNMCNYEIEQLYPNEKKVKWRAILSWALGFLTYYYFAYINTGIGATFPSLVTTFLIYSLLHVPVLLKVRRK